jgi:nitronate monooxygenase
MGGAANANFAIEVSRHGALGMVGAGTKATAESVHDEIGRAAASGFPFGVGVLAWIVDRQPDLLETVIEAHPPLVSISFGNYAAHLEACHRAGITVATQACTVEEARQAAAAGVDIIVARGGEGGGHGRDEMATLPLLQEVLDAVDVPVLAAGGIATSRGLAAVLAAGAAGAWVGTAFLGCVETAWSDVARQRVIEAGDGETIYTTAFDVGLHLDWPPGYGGRALRNRFSQRWHGHEAELAKNDQAATGLAAAIADLDTNEAPVWAGQAVSLINEMKSVGQVLAEFAEAEPLLRRWAGGIRLDDATGVLEERLAVDNPLR